MGRRVNEDADQYRRNGRRIWRADGGTGLTYAQAGGSDDLGRRPILAVRIETARGRARIVRRWPGKAAIHGQLSASQALVTESGKLAKSRLDYAAANKTATSSTEDGLDAAKAARDATAQSADAAKAGAQAYDDWKTATAAAADAQADLVDIQINAAAAGTDLQKSLDGSAKSANDAKRAIDGVNAILDKLSGLTRSWMTRRPACRNHSWAQVILP